MIIDSSPRVNPFDKGFGEGVANAEGLTLPLDSKYLLLFE